MARWIRGPALVLALWAAACGPEGTATSGAERELRAAAPPARGSGGVNADRHLDADYVVLVSFDGFRHDYLDAVETPNFQRLIRGGARAVSLIPVFPTKTFPTHYSMATGMHPARHGLVDNSFWDPERGERFHLADRAAVEDGSWYGGEPIWVTAETQGMVSAAYFWVGTEADVAGVRPTFWRPYDGSVPNEDRVDRALEWLSLPERERPHLVLLYFADVDRVAHRHGPDGPEVRRTVRAMDALLGRLVEGLESLSIASRVHLLVVSDHGLAAGEPEKAHVLSDHVELEGIRVEGWGPYLSLHFEGDTERRDRVRETLAGALPRVSVLRVEETPARWHYRGNPRLGDLLVVAELPWLVGAGPATRSRASGGHHGWDPAHQEMHGIFVARGPRIREGVLVPSLEMVHLYPLVAHLLGLEGAPGIDGRLEEVRALLRERAGAGPVDGGGTGRP